MNLLKNKYLKFKQSLMYSFQLQNYHKIIILFSWISIFYYNCGTPLSFREQCYERNRCDSKEVDCYLQNLSFYSLVQTSGNISAEDAGIVFSTCDGLKERCQKNCESSTLF